MEEIGEVGDGEETWSGWGEVRDVSWGFSMGNGELWWHVAVHSQTRGHQEHPISTSCSFWP